MNPETKNCQNCKKDFTIESEDFAFYEKIKVPPPTWCPECRFVRRLVVRNERSLYKRQCALCGKDKIMIYGPDYRGAVYCYQCWWGDTWDASTFGKEYDFSKSFFEQFKNLFASVPRMGIIQQGMNVNSEYTNRASDNKDSYLIFAASDNENCYYGTSYWDAKDCVDDYNIYKSERLYECIDCYDSSNLRYSQECHSCLDSSFLFNCRNCSNCFGCVNLRNAQYCIFNKQYSKEEYKKKLEDLAITPFTINGYKERVANLRKNNPLPCLMQHRGVDVSGNWLEECKNIKNSFSCKNAEDGKYLFGISGAKDVMDYTYWGASSGLMYEDINIGRQCASVSFSHESWDQLTNAQYCINCHSSSNVFGCVGLRKKQYCILNKQYTKEEYEELVPRIIQHMDTMPYVDAKGRKYTYGEFFPPELSPFAYNETIAQEYFPLTKEEAREKGYRWRDPDIKNYQITKTPDDLPDHIKDVEDSITEEVIGCSHGGTCNHQCTTAFKIIPQELQFYRQMNLPLPRLCPNCRHYERLKQRNPLKLWHRTCQCSGEKSEARSTKSETFQYTNTATHTHGDQPCPTEFETSYAPDRPEIVYCEQCYNAEVA